MTAMVLAFPERRKPRREIVTDLAARVLPKVLGILQSSPIDAGDHPYINREIDSFRFRADNWAPEPSVRFAEVSVRAQESVVLEAYIYYWPQRIGTNLLFDRRVWLRQFDFKRRADWIPRIAALQANECSPEAFYAWCAPLLECE